MPKIKLKISLPKKLPKLKCKFDASQGKMKEDFAPKKAFALIVPDKISIEPETPFPA